MYKLAILGCENSHAWTFAEHIYTNEKYKDIEPVGRRTKRAVVGVKEDGNAPYPNQNPKQFAPPKSFIIMKIFSLYQRKNQHGEKEYLHMLPRRLVDGGNESKRRRTRPIK